MTTRPTAVDPLLGVLAPRALESPLSAAVAYSFLATGTSFFAAALERRLVNTTTVYWGVHHLIIHPFLSNVSTILDFALLNPLVIFFLLRSRRIAVDEPLLATTATPADRALRWFISILSAVLSVVLMLAYSRSFLYGRFFDAVVTISDDGRSFITVTGWIVFFWTGLFTYILISGAVSQVSYVVRICRLQPADITYEPLHEDGVAGLRTLAAPAIDFTKASAVLLVIGIVFWLYDRLMLRSSITDRTESLALFIAIIFPLFAVPILRLHNLMCGLREQLLRSVLGRERRGLRRVIESDGDQHDPDALKHLTDEVEAAEKLRNCILGFPTWPIPTATLVSCGAYFASLAAPTLTKLLPVLAGALGFSH